MGFGLVAADRLPSDGTYNYEWDNEGNRTKPTNVATGAVTEYTWDHRNRLTEVTERASAEGPAPKVVGYTYEAVLYPRGNNDGKPFAFLSAAAYLTRIACRIRCLEGRAPAHVVRPSASTGCGAPAYGAP